LSEPSDAIDARSARRRDRPATEAAPERQRARDFGLDLLRAAAIGLVPTAHSGFLFIGLGDPGPFVRRLLPSGSICSSFSPDS